MSGHPDASQSALPWIIENLQILVEMEPIINPNTPVRTFALRRLSEVSHAYCACSDTVVIATNSIGVLILILILDILDRDTLTTRSLNH